MTAKSRTAVEAELRACRGYADRHVTRLVCRMIDRAVRAERARWQRLDDARLDALKAAEERLAERMKTT